jgi:hypothetical protein
MVATTCVTEPIETMGITLAQCASRSDDVLFQIVAGEAVLLDLKREHYFGLNDVGTRIWQLLETAGPLQGVYDTICAEYDADPERIRADLIELMQALERAGLIQVS